MKISFSNEFARTMLKMLLLIAMVLCFLTFATGAYGLYYGQDAEVLGINLENGFQLLDVDQERNIPTWFSSSVLLLCSALLAAISSSVKTRGDPYTPYWGIMSIIFVLLSVDEHIGIHETTIRPLRSLLDTGGLLYSAWVIPAGAFVVIFGLAYMRFVFKLPVKIQRLFIAAGALYVLGSLGMEMPGGLIEELHDTPGASSPRNLPYLTLATIEEFFEMTGAIIFLYALMRYITSIDDTDAWDKGIT